MVKIDFSSHIPEARPEKTGSKLPLLLLVVLLIVGGVTAFFLMGGEEEPVKTPVVAKKVTPPKPTPIKKVEPKPEPVQAVPEKTTPKVVEKEKLPKKEEKVVKVTGPEIPLEVFQNNASLSNFIKLLGKKTAKGIGYSSIVVKGSQYFYMRGLAQDKGKFNSLKSSIQSVVESSELPALKPVGAGEQAVDFTYYGKVKKSNSRPNPKAVSEKEISQVIRKMENLFKKKAGANLKVKKTITEEYPRSTGHHFEARVKVSFEKISGFLNALTLEKSPIALKVLSLKVGDSEDMIAHLTFVVYSKK